MSNHPITWRRHWGGVLLSMMLYAGTAAAAEDPACPHSQGFKLLASAEHLYLGEGHGTEEVPALVRCLTQAALDRGAKSLVVSLELPNPDRPEGKSYWQSNHDGKSSKAMWQLFQWLRVREAAGRLAIHYQYDGTPWNGQAAYERHVGEGLKALIDQGHALIAYGGNFHSRKEVAPYLPDIVPTGAVVGPAILHVDVEAVEGGTAWDCRKAEGGEMGCAIHDVHAFDAPGAQPGDLMDGAAIGHDRLYLLRRFTASEPQFP